MNISGINVWSIYMWGVVKAFYFVIPQRSIECQPMQWLGIFDTKKTRIPMFGNRLFPDVIVIKLNKMLVKRMLMMRGWWQEDNDSVEGDALWPRALSAQRSVQQHQRLIRLLLPPAAAAELWMQSYIVNLQLQSTLTQPNEATASYSCRWAFDAAIQCQLTVALNISTAS